MLGELAPALDHVAREVVACVDATRHAHMHGVSLDHAADAADLLARTGASTRNIAIQGSFNRSSGALRSPMEV